MNEIRLDDILQKLKTSGLRRTQARRAILNLLVEEQGPFSIEEIHQRLRSHGCDLNTVLRNVVSLEKAGLLRRLDVGDKVKRFELHAQSHSQHSVSCRVCGNSESINYDIPKSVMSSIKRKGFREVETSLEFSGICSDCQSTTH